MPPLDVEWSSRFRLYMTGLRRLTDGRPRNAHHMMLDGLERLSAQLAYEHICFGLDHQLRDDPHGNNLRGVLRFKFGRGRLFYIASRERRLVIVLHYGDTRRAGDPTHDAYAEMARLVRSTEFDRLFEKVGVKKPT